MITRQDLNVVIESNVALQKRAQNLNIRSGEDVFKIMSQSELSEWLKERLNGARCIMEIPHLDELYLPELETKLVDKVLKDNPDKISVDKVTVAVEYGKDWNTTYARVQVEEELARNTKLEEVTLPGGRNVTLVCGSHSAPNFAELVEKLEQSRIEQAWSTARSAQEVSDYVQDMNIITGWFSKIYLSVEITKTDNNSGESILGWFSLESRCSGDYFSLRLRDSLAKAQEETKASLGHLFKRATRESVVIPKETPWQKEGYWNWELTEIGQALQNRLSYLTETQAEDLTPANIQEKIEQLKVEVEKIKSEVGGNFVECQNNIQQAENAVNEKIETIGDDEYFVRTEIEQVRDLINQAKQELKSLNYDQVKENCSRTAEVADSLGHLVTARTQARDEAKEVFAKVESDLENIYYKENDFSRASQDDSENASNFRSEINSSLNEHRYDDVVNQVKVAEEFITSVKGRIAKYDTHQEIVRIHVNSAYGNCGYFDDEEPPIGSYISVHSGHPLFDALYSDIEAQEDEFIRIMESKIGERLISWLEAKNYSNDEIEFYIRVVEVENEDIYFASEADIANITVTEIWEKPNEAVLNARAEVKQLEDKIAYLQEEQRYSEQAFENIDETVERSEQDLQNNNAYGDEIVRAKFRSQTHDKFGKQYIAYLQIGALNVKMIANLGNDDYPITAPSENTDVYCKLAHRMDKTDGSTFQMWKVKPMRGDWGAYTPPDFSDQISEAEKALEQAKNNLEQAEINEQVSGSDDPEDLTPEMLEDLKKHFKD